MNYRKLILWGMCIGLFVWFILFTGPLSQFFNHVKGKSGSHVIVMKDAHDEQLLKDIEDQADRLKEEPIDARIDPVWKAIPGYNGRKVNVEDTFRLAKKLKGSPIPYVYEEIKPRIQLEDLGPVPVYRGNPRKPMVAFMVNVAWGNEFIPDMLETLQEHGVKATFFLDGSWLSKNIDLAKQIQDEGHELSNHAYSHKMMSQQSREVAISEIMKTEQLLKDQLGVSNRFFAPPAGDFNDNTVRIAHELGLQTVLWSLDTVDWKNPHPETLIRRVSRGLEPGSLILMHPTYSSSTSLAELIRIVQDKQLTLGTVSEMLSSDRVILVESPFHF